MRRGGTVGRGGGTEYEGSEVMDTNTDYLNAAANNLAAIGNAGDADTVKDAIAELARLRRIVATLPKDKNGKAIYPGCEVRVYDGGEYLAVAAWKDDIGRVWVKPAGYAEMLLYGGRDEFQVISEPEGGEHGH